MNAIYLDHNATAPLDPRVLEAMVRVERDGLANPASQHGPGRRARRLLEEAREGIASLLGTDVTSLRPDLLVFTSGGTEANNLALFGLTAAAARAGKSPGEVVAKPRLIVSAIEHSSIREAAEVFERRGGEVARVRVTVDGLVDREHLDELLESPAALVSVMLANAETGVLQPVGEFARKCAAAGVWLHTDAAQAIGKVRVNFHELGVAAMSVAPHKFHGPLGIGALLVRSDVPLEPQLFGGFQQAGLRPGTEPVALAIGFHEALKLWHAEAEARQRKMTDMRDSLEGLLTSSVPGAFVAGGQAPRLPHTLNISFPGVNRQALVMALDMAGVACSTGSACASGSSEPSPVLRAMGLPAEVIEGSIRLSLGAFTTPAEVAESSRRILRCVNSLQQAKTGSKSPLAAT